MWNKILIIVCTLCLSVTLIVVVFTTVNSNKGPVSPVSSVDKATGFDNSIKIDPRDFIPDYVEPADELNSKIAERFHSEIGESVDQLPVIGADKLIESIGGMSEVLSLANAFLAENLPASIPAKYHYIPEGSYDDLLLFEIDNSGVRFFLQDCRELAYDGSDYVFEGPTERTGSDYANVYWINGVPDNYTIILDRIWDLDISAEQSNNYVPWFISDYISGDTCNLTDAETGKTITIKVY